MTCIYHCATSANSIYSVSTDQAHWISTSALFKISDWFCVCLYMSKATEINVLGRLPNISMLVVYEEIILLKKIDEILQ